LTSAAACAAEAFAYHARDHLFAGRRPLGLSLWSPGRDWLALDPSEPALAYLPSRLWFIGLGNLAANDALVLAAGDVDTFLSVIRLGRIRLDEDNTLAAVFNEG